jgi:hypothetical protein
MRAGGRVEVVEPRDHWHAARVAERFPLARGWQRQADVERSTALYAPDPLAPAPLTPEAYRGFLDANAVAVVAVAPDAPVDFGSGQERDLVLRGLPYLVDAGRHGAWQLFRVRDPAPLVRSGPARVVAGDDTGVTLQATGPGEVRVAVRWTPYAVVTPGGCARDDDGWTAVRLPAPGTYRLSAAFRPLAAVTARHGSCPGS